MQIHTACTVHADTSAASSSHYPLYCELGIKPCPEAVNQVPSSCDAFKELAGVWPPVTQKWVSEAEPDHILSHILLYIFRTSLHCDCTSHRFLISVRDSWPMLIPVSCWWPLVWLSGSWFLAMYIRLLSQFWTWALTFGLNSPCSSL